METLQEGVLLYHKIKDMLARNWIVKLSHVYRESNICVDWMANYSLEQSTLKFGTLPPFESSTSSVVMLGARLGWQWVSVGRVPHSSPPSPFIKLPLVPASFSDFTGLYGAGTSIHIPVPIYSWGRVPNPVGILRVSINLFIAEESALLGLHFDFSIGVAAAVFHTARLRGLLVWFPYESCNNVIDPDHLDRVRSTKSEGEFFSKVADVFGGVRVVGGVLRVQCSCCDFERLDLALWSAGCSNRAALRKRRLNEVLELPSKNFASDEA
ncbi:hypothetical protein PIB30_049291 [Stylosanthes scabra]|uniref:RNase H type-1 domain-containing protein n=1 Tax=Stylosanthes scabra TaxID=79078 RepID=A0ABU6QHH0_9FABA|nr:hypothetical protein [Stylosanthes scabra]